MTSRPNPYIGPRSFRVGERIYGREKETATLLDLLIAERIVLLYSPSGAGKTSLIQAALIPALERAGFAVLPTIRVNSAPPPPTVGVASTDNSDVTVNERPANRFLLSAMLALEDALPDAQQQPVNVLSTLSFGQYLAQRPRPDNDDRPDLLIFDQFEEILTVDPTAIDAKHAFFEQVGAALRDKRRWALFSMREDFIAGLDPYVKPIPTRLATTFRLDLLDLAGARAAVQQPASAAGVTFEDTAANKLLDDLRRIKVAGVDGAVTEQLGPYIEPVQLQVVCRQLWEQLAEADTQIDVDDVAKIGNVDSALADYYRAQVAQAATHSSTPERAIRDWCEQALITPQGLRSQVMHGPDSSGGLANAAITALVDSHLVRSEKRRGIGWFELAHDRLIRPVQRDNAAWREANLTPLQRQAALWEQSGRPDGMLFRDAPLREAEAQVAQPDQTLTATEQTFLDESRRLRAATEREQRANRLIRWLLGAALVGLVISIITVVLAVQARDAATVAQDRALASQYGAFAKANLPIDPELSVLISLVGYDTPRDDVPTDVRDALQTSLHEVTVIRTLGASTPITDVVGVWIAADGATSSVLHRNGTLTQWDAAGAQRASWTTDQRDLTQLASNRDGTQFATGANDGSLRRWNADGSPRDTLPAAAAAISALAYAPDGQLAVADVGGTTRIFAADGTLQETFDADGDALRAVAWNGDGSRLAMVGDQQIVRVWDVRSGTELYVSEPTIHTDRILALAWNATTDIIATASADRTIRLWAAQTFQLQQTLNGHTDWVTGLVFAADGRLASISNDSTARVWDPRSGALLGSHAGHTQQLRAIAWSADGQRLLTGSVDGTVRLWHTPAGHTDVVNDVSWTSDDARFVTAGRDNRALIWDAASGDVLATFAGHTDGLYTARYRPDDGAVLTASRDGTALIWDPATLAVQQRFAVGAVVYAAIWSPDGARVATADHTGRLIVWNATTGASLLTVAAHRDAIYGLAWSPNGQRIATGSADRSAAVWNASTGAEIWRLPHPSTVSAVAWNPDSTRLATGGYDALGRVWNVADGTLVMELRGHTRQINAITYSTDGDQIATGGDDRTVRVWRASDYVYLDTFPGHDGAVVGVRYAYTTARFATTSADRRARVFFLDINDLAQTADARITRALTQSEICEYIDSTPDACGPSGERQTK